MDQSACRMAIKHHKEALVCQRNFWSSLMHSHVHLNGLMIAVRKIDFSSKAADRVYK